MRHWSHLSLKEIEAKVRELQRKNAMDDELINGLLSDPRIGAQRLGHRLIRESQLAAEEEKRWLEMKFHETEARRKGFHMIAGVDEAGRGPLAGPVVAAAVILPQTAFIPGLNDSKKLSPEKREAIFDSIKTNSISIGIGMAQPEKIDRFNILRATHMAMSEAAQALKPLPDFVLVDGNLLPHLPVPAKALISGDALSVSVAAASIVAKVTRDRMMVDLDKLYPQYGFAKHKGYGTREHIQAIKEHGLCPIHRKSFCLAFGQLSLGEI